MGEMSDKTFNTSSLQAKFEWVTALVLSQFQVEESILEHGVPTYYLKESQETKQPFLNLLKKLEENNFVAVLRKVGERKVLKVIPKPEIRRSNVLFNWMLFFATIGTTFITGYLLSMRLTDPVIGGNSFHDCHNDYSWNTRDGTQADGE